MNFTAKNNCFSEVDLENIRNKSSLNDLFLNSDSFYNCILHISSESSN